MPRRIHSDVGKVFALAKAACGSMEAGEARETLTWLEKVRAETLEQLRDYQEIGDPEAVKRLKQLKQIKKILLKD